VSTHTPTDVTRAVRDRYARAAATPAACCEPSCCGDKTSAVTMSRAIGYTEEQLGTVPEEANLGLGCGNPTALAQLRPGETVLDLGSGAGIDCFLAAVTVGPEGLVIGVDMTPEMVDRARRNAKQGAYQNVEFRLGEIEALPVADESVDVVLSNCVLNLTNDKARVLREAFRVLRSGGRLVVSDMVSDQEIPSVLAGSLDAVAGCLPTFRAEYLAVFEKAGFTDVVISSETPYPMSYIMEDVGVVAFLAEHPGAAGDLERFAASISGAHFSATKP